MIEQPISVSQPSPETAPDPLTEAPLASAPAIPRPPTAGVSGRVDLTAWQAALGLAILLLVGGYFRFTGINWDEGHQLHPDERSIVSTAEGIRPLENILTYFDTTNSTLNPFPFGSYTYGMFPLFLTKYVGEYIGDSIQFPPQGSRYLYIGRTLSGIFDLAAVLMLFFLGARLYSRRVGLLAAALYAAAVLPIQLSHYLAVDSFATVFIIAAFYVAVPTMDRGQRWHYAVFGLLTGLAMACKINTLPLAGIIVLTGGLRLIKGWQGGEDRRAILNEVIVGWLIAGVLAALTFRVFQPYAFNGPGLFGVSLNQRWLEIMREVTDQVAGKADYPPNTHWTDRSQLTYAYIQNVVWGMGGLLGVVATLGWAWAAWRAWHEASFQPEAKREWRSHLLLVVWVGLYFAWQNAQFWRYMRYFMPIYPFAILLAAWFMIDVVDRLKARPAQTVREQRQAAVLRVGSLLLIGLVLLTTYGYAFAFTRIYTRPHSRVAASRWMLANMPGPLNAHLTAPDGATKNQPLSVPRDMVWRPGDPPWVTTFNPVASGTISEFTARLYPPDSDLQFRLTFDPEGNNVMLQGSTVVRGVTAANVPASVFLAPQTLAAGQTYYLHYTIRSPNGILLSQLSLADDRGRSFHLLGEIAAYGVEPISGFLPLTPDQELSLDRLNIGSLQVNFSSEPGRVRLILSQDFEGNNRLRESEIEYNPAAGTPAHTFSFAPIQVEQGTQYFISLQVLSGTPVRPAGTMLVLETGWDDWLPLRVDGYDPFGGIYSDKDLDLYGQDNEAKRSRMIEALNQADYIVITSNRSYDAMPRLPLRYPMTLKYYQELFGCGEQLIYKCAYPAQEGLKGPLGFELVKVFESNPNLGPFEFSDQTAEEAFTVYDHPKVMIFQRTADYDPQRTAAVLNSIDLTQVLEQSPFSYTAMPTALRLPPDRLQAQRTGGTWRELFNAASLLAQNQPLYVVAWYLLIVAIGLVTWPIVFVVMKGLPDRGYPVSKLIGLLIITWVAWFGGSYRLLQSTGPMLWIIALALAVFGGYVAWRNREALVSFTRAHRNYLLIVEAITLALFLFFLGVRWLNPDLWHPWLGGEKPADFSFFQSAIRAVYFPPYDPWLAGHYVNYYYYGYVICATPTKLLGIAPAVAYNLVLPTLFAFAGIGAFCAAYNLVARDSEDRPSQAPADPGAAETTITAPAASAAPAPLPRLALLAGVSAMVMMVLLGNLYQVRLLWKHLPEVADPPAGQSSNLIEQAGNVFSGGWRVLSGQAQLPGLPGDKGRWYFAASRAILHDGPDTPITEFPYFSFLYADLHPHLTSMSLMLAALVWMMSLVFAASRRPDPGAAPATEAAPAGPLSERERPRWRWPTLESVLSWFIAGLVFGALQPTQTWDFPVFVLLGVFSIAASVWLQERTLSRVVLLGLLWKVVLFVGLSVGMYYAFRQWFATEFTSIELWKFTRTPLSDYFTVHGLFLFVIITLLIWETRAWVKAIPTDYLLHTPLGQLLPRYRTRILLVLAFLVIAIVGTIGLWTHDYVTTWFAALLLVFAALVFFKPGQSISRRAWLVIVAAGIGLTIVVEVITLRGDLGRSNTVFKYYIEVWIFFSVAAGAALAWLLPGVLREWSRRSRQLWLTGLTLLVAAAASYTVLGTYTKVTDRWPGIDDAPHTLDGNAYMLGSMNVGDTSTERSAVYDDDGALYVLAHDYQAIRWLQDNVDGTPVLVEGMSPIPDFRLYRWGTRMAINTGLPTIVGWDHHLKQHDSTLPGIYVDNRILELRDFYNTRDPEEAMAFINRYSVGYIVVGGLERKYYEADGLAKFRSMTDAGQLELVFPVETQFPDDATYVYRVADLHGNN